MDEDLINLIDVFSEAASCEACFDGSLSVDHSNVTGGQPRWIGEDYWQANKRVLFILVNPGSGVKTPPDRWHPMLAQLSDPQDERRVAAWHEAQQINDEYMPVWGKWEDLYFEATGLASRKDQVAFLNVALCGAYPPGKTKNKVSGKSLTRCYEKHSRSLLEILAPDICILSGSAVTGFFLKQRELEALRAEKGASRRLHSSDFKVEKFGELPDACRDTRFYFMGHYAARYPDDEKAFQDAAIIKREIAPASEVRSAPG